MTRQSLIAALAVTLIGLPVAAETGGPFAGRAGFDFATADADGDGLITPEELALLRTTRIGALDLDGDGFVTRAELVTHAEARAAARIATGVDARIARLDGDGDGRLSLEELGKAQNAGRGEDREARMFRRLDSNGDGAISEAELTAFRAERQDRRGDRRGRRHR